MKRLGALTGLTALCLLVPACGSSETNCTGGACKSTNAGSAGMGGTTGSGGSATNGAGTGGASRAGFGGESPGLGAGAAGSAGEGDGSGGASGAGGGGTSAGAAGDDGAAGGGSPPSVDDFCARWVDEFSRYMERCGCESSAIGSYGQSAPALCEPAGYFGALPAAVAAGDLTYHPEAADALFARLHEPAPLCVQEPFRSLGLDSVEVYSLAGVFVGTHALGAACSRPISYKGGVSDCREGVCASNGAGTGVCVAFVALGDECDASGNENLDAAVPRLCHDQRPADIDGEYETAFDSLSCAPSALGAATRVCARALSDGEPCHSGEACRSGYCRRVAAPSSAAQCAPKLADGEPCQGHGECASGACQNGVPRVCGALLTNGEVCDYADEACDSGYCDSIAGGPVCADAPSREVGATCASSSECISLGNSGDGTCHEGQCIPDICAAYLR